MGHTANVRYVAVRRFFFVGSNGYLGNQTAHWTIFTTIFATIFLLFNTSMYYSVFFSKTCLPKRLTTLLLLAATSTAIGQDLRYSQFYLHPVLLTPAATGVFQGTIRVAGQHRSQWEKVPVDYETSTGSVEWKAVVRKNNALSVGLVLQNDRAGDAGLSWMQAGAVVGVAHALNNNHSVSLGFGMAFVQRSFNVTRLTFKNQWGGDAYDPSLATGETFNRSSQLAPSLSTGGQWHYQRKQTRTQVDVGVGVSHINKPFVNFSPTSYVLQSRSSAFAHVYAQVRENTDLVFFAEGQEMAHAGEMVFGTGIRQIISTGVANESYLQVTFGHRVGDALIPAIQFERNNWTLGLSYDWNISTFETASRGRGGIEIATVWRKVPVPPFQSKICPLF